MRKIYGYAWVSTKKQNLDRQILALQKFGIDDRDIIRDKTSGKTLDREGYKMVRNHLLREGDSLILMSLDRLSRNKVHAKREAFRATRSGVAGELGGSAFSMVAK